MEKFGSLASNFFFDTWNPDRDHFVDAPSQWEMTWQCHVASHWLSAYKKIISAWQQVPTIFCLPDLMLLHLTNWGRVTHICASKVTIIVSDNGLSPGRHQAIIWTNAGILLIIGIDTNIEVIVSLTTWEALHSPRATPSGCGELPTLLMRQRWPKLRYQFLFYHDENKLTMNKQIL